MQQEKPVGKFGVNHQKEEIVFLSLLPPHFFKQITVVKLNYQLQILFVSIVPSSSWESQY